ncbi:MAG: VTT domain-containing protein [Ruminococcus sp.]|nr:VTT domain-containing protein [Ruminococcus sp.]
MIPGGPIPIVEEILFGKVGALVLCLVGFFLGTVLVYYLVQWIGRSLVDRFVSEETFRKFDFLLEGKHLEWLVFLVFFLPGLPKDALTYLVSFNPKIKPMRLFLITTIGRTPATILTIFLGGSIWDGDYSLALILAGVMVLLAILGFFIK